jgi:malate dehydrogenase (oxaloacetate-decarboxylating)(NADP+)
METGVATKPLEDLEAYKERLNASVFKSALLMRPVFDAASHASRRIIFAEGEDERVLRAAQAILEETTERPILIGRPEVIEARCERFGITARAGKDFELVNPENDPRYRDFWGSYHEIMARKGVTPDLARAIMRTNTTAIGAIAVHRGEADSLICGTFGEFRWHLNYVQQVLGSRELRPHGALSMMILEDGPLFIADTHVHTLPTPEQIAEAAIGAARHAKRFGVEPKVALCSQSQFGNQPFGSGERIRAAIEILDAAPRDFQYEGEMNVDAALDPELRERLLPAGRLEGVANVLIFGHADAASAGAQYPENEGGRARSWPDPHGYGKPCACCQPRDHGAGTAQYGGDCGHACEKLWLSFQVGLRKFANDAILSAKLRLRGHICKNLQPKLQNICAKLPRIVTPCLPKGRAGLYLSCQSGGEHYGQYRGL